VIQGEVCSVFMRPSAALFSKPSEFFTDVYRITFVTRWESVSCQRTWLHKVNYVNTLITLRSI
jgi:hypothetical protein